MTFPVDQAGAARRLRVGISGYGLAGRVFHAPLLASCGFDVAGVVTNNPERQAQVRGDFPSAQVLGSIHDLVALNLDLVVVASGNSAHASDAIAALESGAHVVVDKPMGRTVAEIKSILSVAQSHGRMAIPFFNRLWDSDALTIQKIIDEKILGNIFRMESRFERFRPGNTPKNWRESASLEEGGGNLLDLQPHLISTALDWFGPATLEYASVRNIRKMSDDDVVLVLNHENGVDSYLAASAIIGAPGPRIRLSGDEGTLIIRDLDGQEDLLRSGKSPTHGIWNPPVRSKAEIHRGGEVVDYPSIGGEYGAFYAAVAAAIQGAGKWPTTGEMALDVARIIDQAKITSTRSL